VLPLAQADHGADLPKADMTRAAPAQDDAASPAEPRQKRLSQPVKVAIFILIFLVLYIVLDRF
jgi:hypothetical protein